MYVALFATTLGFTACGSDDDGADCIALTNQVADAASNFIDDSSTANCNAYRAALQSFLDSGCSPDQETEDSIRTQLTTLGDCTAL